MPLDHCTAPEVGYREAQIALKRTTHWLSRSADYLVADRRHRHERQEHEQWLFGIVQGNFYLPLRTQSAEQITALDLSGYAIGGLSVGEEWSRFVDTLVHTAQLLPDRKPRYLMGVGTPEYLLRAIAEGIDMVDCVYPTRAARHGVALTEYGRMNMRKSAYRADSQSLDGNCECNTCRKYSRAYINHLCSRREIMAILLLSEHNLFFMRDLCIRAQRAIREQRYRSFARDFLDRYTESSADTRSW